MAYHTDFLADKRLEESVELSAEVNLRVEVVQTVESGCGVSADSLVLLVPFLTYSFELPLFVVRRARRHYQIFEQIIRRASAQLMPEPIVPFLEILHLRRAERLVLLCRYVVVEVNFVVQMYFLEPFLFAHTHLFLERVHARHGKVHVRERNRQCRVALTLVDRHVC
jgi:hypothetical protein